MLAVNDVHAVPKVPESVQPIVPAVAELVLVCVSNVDALEFWQSLMQ